MIDKKSETETESIGAKNMSYESLIPVEVVFHDLLLLSWGYLAGCFIIDLKVNTMLLLYFVRMFCHITLCSSLESMTKSEITGDGMAAGERRWIRWSAEARGAIGSDIVFTIFVSAPIIWIRIRILTDVKNDIRIRQNRISDIVRILVDRMRTLIGYVKIDTVKDKLNEYTYITFYRIYNNIKCVHIWYYFVHINASTLSLSFGFYSNELHDLRC